jgi:hypothetical protein
MRNIASNDDAGKFERRAAPVAGENVNSRGDNHACSAHFNQGFKKARGAFQSRQGAVRFNEILRVIRVLR